MLHTFSGCACTLMSTEQFCCQNKLSNATFFCPTFVRQLLTVRRRHNIVSIRENVVLYIYHPPLLFQFKTQLFWWLTILSPIPIPMSSVLNGIHSYRIKQSLFFSSSILLEWKRYYVLGTLQVIFLYDPNLININIYIFFFLNPIYKYLI